MPKEIVGVTLERILGIMAMEAAKIAIPPFARLDLHYLQCQKMACSILTHDTIEDKHFNLVFCPHIPFEVLDETALGYVGFGRGIIENDDTFAARGTMPPHEYMEGILPSCEKFFFKFFQDELGEEHEGCLRNKFQPVRRFLDLCPRLQAEKCRYAQVAQEAASCA